MKWGGLLALVIAVAVSACDLARDEGLRRFSDGGIGLDVPASWSVTHFSADPTPPRLVAASYEVTDADVAGDCGGLAAVERLPNDGAYVVLIDYGPLPGNVDLDYFRDDSPVFGRDDPFKSERFGNFGCFGASYVYLFVTGGRALQAHIGLGEDSSQERRDEAVRVLDSIVVES